MAASIVLAFVTSSIDDFVLLVCLYADRFAKTLEVTGAKLLCAALTLGAAIVCASACLALPVAVSRAVGIIPLALGVKRLIAQRGQPRETPVELPVELPHGHTWSSMRRFAGYTVILGAASFDNVALYIPLFVQGQRAGFIMGVGMILPMTALLCVLALLASRLRIAPRTFPVRLDAAVPYLMMFIGIKSLAASLA
jgi:cadmium resistance protein CadD (predicted permease)